uniref:RING-type domain-containing protein n=1 Tax=Meloidogyne hapla TaxID=6305 RepID=A0A1I8BLB5_MELHA
MVCSICLDELFDDGTFQNFTKSLKEITLIHVCGHQFHKKCLDRALVDKLRCPKCRIDIDRSSFGPLSDVLVQQQGQQDAQQGQQDDHGHGNENGPGPEYNGHENGLQELHDPQNVLEHVHENEYLALDRAVLEHQHVPPVLDGHGVFIQKYEVHRVGTKMRLLCKCGTNVERFWVKWLHHEPSWEDVNQIVGQESCQEALAYWQARHLVGSTPERLVDHVDNDRAHEQPTWVLSGNKRKVLTESARPARSSAVRQLFRSSTIIPAFQPLIDDVNNALRNLQQLVHHGPEPVQLQELQRVQHE